MNQILKIALLSISLLLIGQVGFSQKKKKGKKGKKECPTYTEDIQTSLPKYEMPNFEPDTNAIAPLEAVILVDDSHKVDSVQGVLVKYYSKKTITSGWRIQVWTGQKQGGMKTVTAKYNENFEELDLYVHEIWDQTFFRVKIGDFTDRLEAYKALIKIKEHFPTALLVPDQIDLDKI